ncbi:putative transcriptional regulator [Catenulispora acidiphila DSM 44928]|uniref:Putative transcriptional regulator n=1 Tax=Catenulispora acidiphila (strain DSM 44928 / JCM 14897 / NBRC 102108 / NRRL B-24433 / ID139908) TaxID=479433 RepID=C7PZ97_CATAD|nr:helix-turn-helix domain-containing protein [Catenulispora acidiphila]ACU71554.1 putative transcriptional regulator [Catenulispora acidiphila DSM 44928]
MTTAATPPEPTAENRVESVAVLTDGQRRRVFGFVRRARRPVTREEVAADSGVSVKLAAFHLDKLVEAGLLRTRYETPAGVRKVGRRPKVYEPTGTDIHISIPERRPDVIAEILIDAVLTEHQEGSARAAALRTAHRRGHDVGSAERARTRPGRLGPERSLNAVEPVLESYGFEPDRQAPTTLRLLNCPFHHLTARDTELVCGINHAFLTGVLDGLETTGINAVLAPHPGRCCVEFCEPGADAGA